MENREKELQAREQALLQREKQLEAREKALQSSAASQDGIYSKINISLKVWNWVCVGLFSLLVAVIAIAIVRAL